MSKQLEKQLEKLNKTKAKIKELKLKESAKRRKQETRKKIIIGGAVLALQKQGETFPEIYAYLKSTLKRPADLALFNSEND